MKFRFDVNYSKEELLFLETHQCNILSEIKLSKVNFSENELPRRMFQYGGLYIAEILDNETNLPIWGVLSKWKGTWHFCDCYDSLESLEQGL